MNIQKSALSIAVLGTLALGSSISQAAQVAAYAPVSSTGNNFTLLSGLGGVVAPTTNDVAMNWDGTVFTASSDYVGPGLQPSNMTVHQASTTPFFGHNWTAHDIQVFAPGTYTFQPSFGAGTLSMTVPSGDLGLHLLWDWNGNTIDVAEVLAPNSVFGSGLLYSTVTNSAGQHTCDANFTGTITKNCLYDGPNYAGAAPTKNQKWMLASIVNANSVNGVVGIPTPGYEAIGGFNFNFNFKGTLTPVPVPAAVWLFGSGLLGLMGLLGIARRRKR